MEVSNKDIYSYIVNLADDRDVINMLSVNRKFNDDMYFKAVLEKRYPLLIKHKEKDETYKYFYLKMVKYMAKLWEEYEIPYIPVKNFDPAYMYLKFDKKIYTIALYYAVEMGDIKLAQHLINKGAKINSDTYAYAGQGGSLDMLHFLLKRHYKRKALYNTLHYATSNKHQNMIDHLKKIGIFYQE